MKGKDAYKSTHFKVHNRTDHWLDVVLAQQTPALAWPGVLRRTVACALPSCCLYCRRPTRAVTDLCHHCAAWLPWLDDFAPPIDTLALPAFSLFAYRPPIVDSISAFKYRSERRPARVFGTLLGRAALTCESHRPGSLPDCWLPMPLALERQRQRGYNQAEELARWVARATSRPLATKLARRRVNTSTLTGLSRVERQLEILGAFEVSDSVASRRIGIVDDVVTTGASARELARELQDAGADEISLWTVAATPPPDKEGGS